MVEIDLNTAITILSLNDYVNMVPQKRNDLIEIEELNDDEIFECVRETYIGVCISYIEGKLRKLYLLPIIINGTPKELFACPCCGYKTISEIGNYEICSVCFWEDDGNRDELNYSGPNHMTLKKGKENFKAIGAISEEFLTSVNKEGKFKYYQSSTEE